MHIMYNHNALCIIIHSQYYCNALVITIHPQYNYNVSIDLDHKSQINGSYHFLFIFFTENVFFI